jgi:hypothetical protein
MQWHRLRKRSPTAEISSLPRRLPPGALPPPQLASPAMDVPP